MNANNVNDRKPSGKRKWFWRCGIGCLVVIILFVGLGIWGYFLAKGKIDEITTEFEEIGFERRAIGQVIEVRDSIPEKPLYVGQVVKIFSDSSTDVAVVAQTAEIHGKISGNLYFRGQVLTILPKAEVVGDVNVKAQVIRNMGKIGGKTTGTYQVLKTD